MRPLHRHLPRRILQLPFHHLPHPRSLHKPSRPLTTATTTPHYGDLPPLPLELNPISPPASANPPSSPDLANPLRNDSTIQLRDYQEASIAAVLSHVSAGHRRMGLSLATGAGKTVIFTQLISRVTHPINPQATQTLILAHRQELVHQAYNHCRKTYPDAVIEIEMSKQHASGVADITIASVQSLISGERLRKYDWRRFKLVLIDECHHAVSKSYLQILDHFGVLHMKEETKAEKPIVVGVSATMSRFDGLALGKIMDHIVYHRDYVDMITDSWLSPCLFTTVRTSLDLSRVRKTSPTGDFSLSSLSHVVNTSAANEFVFRTWLTKAATRKSTILFAVDIAHCEELTRLFRSHNIDARLVTGNTPAQVRRDTVTAFRNGEFRVLVNCGVFTEGTDIPNIDCVLLARPTRSKNLLLQMIGRGMRLHPEKKDCHIIDMVGSIEEGMVTTASLIGLDPDAMLEEDTLESARGKKAADKEAKRNMLAGRDPTAAANSPVPVDPPNPMLPTNASVTFTDYASIFDLLSDQRQDSHIRRISQLAWVCVSTHPLKYILSTRSGTVTVSQSDDLKSVSVYETRSLPDFVTGEGSYVKAKPRCIIENAPTLEAAVRGADTFVLARYPRQLVTHNASWRQKPISEGQIKVIEKQLGKTVKPKAKLAEKKKRVTPKKSRSKPLATFSIGAVEEAAEAEEDAAEEEDEGELGGFEVNLGGKMKQVSKMTTGEANDFITRLKHGAKARWGGYEKGRRKIEEQKRRVEELRKREEVKVGKLEA